ncbi:hypothetical protein GCM10020000_37600 [Streptomyces olivoverticillatus]
MPENGVADGTAGSDGPGMPEPGDAGAAGGIGHRHTDERVTVASVWLGSARAAGAA